jgi:hypothetical protein
MEEDLIDKRDVVRHWITIVFSLCDGFGCESSLGLRSIDPRRLFKFFLMKPPIRTRGGIYEDPEAAAVEFPVPREF